MEDKEVTLDKREANLIISGLILLGNEYAMKLMKVQEEAGHTALFKEDCRGGQEMVYEQILEDIRNTWDKIDLETE